MTNEQLFEIITKQQQLIHNQEKMLANCERMNFMMEATIDNLTEALNNERTISEGWKFMVASQIADNENRELDEVLDEMNFHESVVKLNHLYNSK